MKHLQRMMLVPEHLLRSLQTEHCLTSPPQLTTLTLLDQDMKHITDSTLLEDQKVALLDQLLQRYQGLAKQMKAKRMQNLQGQPQQLQMRPLQTILLRYLRNNPKKHHTGNFQLHPSVHPKFTTFSYRTAHRSLDL